MGLRCKYVNRGTTNVVVVVVAVCHPISTPSPPRPPSSSPRLFRGPWRGIGAGIASCVNKHGSPRPPSRVPNSTRHPRGDQRTDATPSSPSYSLMFLLEFYNLSSLDPTRGRRDVRYRRWWRKGVVERVDLVQRG